MAINRSRGIQQQGFSLLELLMVMAIVGLLSGLIFSGLNGIQRWLAASQTQALFKEIEHAGRVYCMENGDWPPELKVGEVALNGNTKWRETLGMHMETPVLDGILVDGFGNTDLRMVVDDDRDHWITGDQLESLKPGERPDKIWARVVLYSLREDGALGEKSW